MKAYSKDIWRSIKKGKKRFLSILMITALGVSMFTGLRAACEDLRYTADLFYDGQNLFDICVVSTLGLTDEDVEVLGSLEGVFRAEGIYGKNIQTPVDGKEQSAELRSFHEQGLNEPYLLEGRLPVLENEIAVTQNYLENSGKKLGDTLTFEEELEEEEDAAFRAGEYVITASVIDPMDVNGSTEAMAFRGSKTTDYTFFVSQKSVCAEIYTAVYLKLADTKEMLCYSGEYEEAIKSMVHTIEEEIKEQREEARYEEITGEAYEEIADAEKEMNEEFRKAEQELSDADEEIADGWLELEDGEKELNEKEREAIGEIADARKQIDEGFSALDGAEEELRRGEEQLNAGREQLNAAKEELSAKEKETLGAIQTMLDSMEAQLEENEEKRLQLDEQKNFLVESMETAWNENAWEVYIGSLTSAYIPYVQAQLLNQQLTEEQLVALLQILGEAKGIFYESLGLPGGSAEGLEKIADGYGQLLAARQVLLAGREELLSQKAFAESEFFNAREKIKKEEENLLSAQKQLDEGWDAVSGNHYTLSQALKELNEKEAEAKEKIADGRAEIEENREKLLDAQQELEDGRKEYEEEKKDALKEIEEAKDEVKKIDMAQWYVRDRGSLSGYANIESDADCIESVGTVFPILFLVVAVLISLTTITRMVEEERGLIGIYKALGFDNAGILKKYLLYAFLASFFGGILGDVCGFIVLPEIIFSIFGIMYVLPQYFIQFDFLYGVGGILIFVLAIVGAAFWACRAELMLMPAALMRPKAPRSGSRIFLERIRPVWRKMSFLNKVTARNLFRYKKRLFMTVSGIVGCTALLVCGFTIKDSVTQLMPQQYEYIYRYDLLAVSSTEDYEKLVSYMEDDEVESYLSIGMESVKLKNQSGDEETIQMIVIPTGVSLESYIHLENEDGETVAPDKEGVLITQNAGMVLDFGKEETVLIQNLKLKQEQVLVTDFVKNYMGNHIYITQELYEACFGKWEPDAVLVKLKDSCENPVAYADAFAKRKGVLSTLSIEKSKEQFSTSVVLINLVVYIIIVMAAGLAFTVLFTLSATNISERERELATIKVLGFFDKEVHLYVNKETLILTGMGILLGLPVGAVLGGLLTEALKMPSIYFAVVTYPVSYVYSAVLTFLFAILVDLLTDRVLDSINPVEALKSVE